MITSKLIIIYLFLIVLSVNCLRKYDKDDIKNLREEVREMFQHAYDGYLKYASNYDELRPLSCDGINTWGSYSLTLIDALDTLAVMGNYTEFNRVVNLLINTINFDTDINVSVFETNIRIVGGLLSAHLLSHQAGAELEPGWPCNGPLLRLAEDVAKRLLPAFDTKTGMPYGTVNLKYGVPPGETSVTCTAGVGTYIVEFGALSRLTGDPIYEEVALNALYSLFEHKSSIGLFGNHIDVQTGRWTAQDSGIGAGIDSYLEYLVKGSIMLNRPELMKMFLENRKPVEKYLKRDDWYIWVSMNKGQVTLPVFQSLEAYWPGLLSLIGDISSAMKTIHNYHTVWRQYGFLPEFYNIPNAEAGVNRENYPLRPELIESAMYLYRATGDPFLLQMGEDILRSIQHSAKTACGYATIKNVRDHNKEDRMESFFLSETTKYLYLLFDPSNFLNNNGDYGVVINTPNGECIINTGGYIFNTEAHPIDPSTLNCCHDMPRNNLLKDYDTKKYLGDLFDINYFSDNDNKNDFNINSDEDESEKSLNNNDSNNITIDTVTDPEETRKNLVNEILNIINATKKSKKPNDKSIPESNDDSLILPINPDSTSTTVAPIDNNKLQIDSPVEIVKITTITERDSDSDKQKSKTNLIDETANVVTPPLVVNTAGTASSINYENNLVNFNENNDDIEIINNTINDTKQKENNYYFNDNDLNENKPLQQQTIINKEILDNNSNNINNNISNNTMLTEFVQTILKTKYHNTNNKKFDSQLLLEKIRLNNKENKLKHNFTVYSNEYKLLTCKAQPYLQRISVLGEFFNN